MLYIARFVHPQCFLRFFVVILQLLQLLLLLSSAFTSRMSSAIRWQCHQLSAIAAAPLQACNVGSC